MDRFPRYAPEKVFTLKGTYPVKRYIAHPPGNHPKGCPIKSDMTVLEMQTEGGSCWYGFEKVWINSELRMVVSGFGSADEVRRNWEKCAEV